MSEVFLAICEENFEKVKSIVANIPESVNVQHDFMGWTPLDAAIAFGLLNIAKFLREKGGKPNLEIYRNERLLKNTLVDTPVHEAVSRKYTATLRWVFTTGNVFPLWVLQTKNKEEKTPLEVAADSDTATLLQNLAHLDAVFLAMELTKRDHQCVLRKLPDELLDVIVDTVASRHNLVRVILW